MLPVPDPRLKFLPIPDPTRGYTCRPVTVAFLSYSVFDFIFSPYFSFLDRALD